MDCQYWFFIYVHRIYSMWNLDDIRLYCLVGYRRSDIRYISHFCPVLTKTLLSQYIITVTVYRKWQQLETGLLTRICFTADGFVKQLVCLSYLIVLMYIIPQLTCTSETSVFSVQTVMVANSIVGAVNKSCLPAVAEQVIQDDGASALAIRGTVKWSCTWKMTRQNIHTPTSATSQTMMYTCDRLCLFFFYFQSHTC